MIVPRAPSRRTPIAEDSPNGAPGNVRKIISRPPDDGRYYPPFRIDGLKNVLMPVFRFGPKLISAVLALLFLPFLPLMLLVALVLWGSSRK